jgi:hypothetical protein
MLAFRFLKIYEAFREQVLVVYIQEDGYLKSKTNVLVYSVVVIRTVLQAGQPRNFSLTPECYNRFLPSPHRLGHSTNFNTNFYVMPK